MMNMQNMMKQAQKLQKQMQASQEEIKSSLFIGKSAQELVSVEFSGDHVMKSITIKPEIIDSEDAETLEEMVTSAVNDALGQIAEKTEKQMGKFNLPF
ncbi:MAG: YbaB/EbfC family nucleoid-associated protein [Lactovum sp.]